jgi:plastocyanin
MEENMTTHEHENPPKADRKRRWTMLLALALLVVVVGAAWKVHSNSKPSAPVVKAPLTAAVKISEDGFLPQQMNVKAGTVVIWTNEDTKTHRVVDTAKTSGTDSLFGSETNMSTSGQYRYKFNSPGTYNYHDALNPKFNGVVIVQ